MNLLGHIWSIRRSRRFGVVIWFRKSGLRIYLLTGVAWNSWKHSLVSRSFLHKHNLDQPILDPGRIL